MTAALSVVLPVHNGLPYLGPAIESLLSQSFADFELLVIDDGSSDGSAALVDGYAGRNPRIRLLRQENRGLIATLNRGLELASTDLVARMDADDLALPERFAKQMAYMRSHPGTAVLGGSLVVIDDDGRQVESVPYPVGVKEVAGRMAAGCAIAHPTVMMRRQVALAVGGYRAAYKHAEDYDLWLRILERADIDNLPDVLLRYRRHGGQVSARNVLRQAETAAIAREMALRRREGKPDPTATLDRPLDDAALAALDLMPDEAIRVRLSMLADLVRSEALRSREGQASALDLTRWLRANMKDCLYTRETQTLWLRAASRIFAADGAAAARLSWAAFHRSPHLCMRTLLALWREHRRARQT